MSTLWEGTTQVQTLRNKGPERGKRETRQGQALTRQKKSLMLCVYVHGRCIRDQQQQQAVAYGAVSASAADVSGIPCSGKMRWRVEDGQRELRQDNDRQAPAGQDHQGFGLR